MTMKKFLSTLFAATLVITISCGKGKEAAKDAEEGEDHLSRVPPNLALLPLAPGEFALRPEWLDAQGCLRTLPNQGLDGFFAMRLRRTR